MQAPVNLGTHNILAKGFCPTGRLVTTVKVLNEYYFTVKDGEGNASVTIETTGSLTCKEYSKGERSRQYGADQKYCAIPGAEGD